MRVQNSNEKNHLEFIAWSCPISSGSNDHTRRAGAGRVWLTTASCGERPSDGSTTKTMEKVYGCQEITGVWTSWLLLKVFMYIIVGEGNIPIQHTAGCGNSFRFTYNFANCIFVHRMTNNFWCLKLCQSHFLQVLPIPTYHHYLKFNLISTKQSIISLSNQFVPSNGTFYASSIEQIPSPSPYELKIGTPTGRGEKTMMGIIQLL